MDSTIIALIISGCALLVSFFSWRDKRNNKKNEEIFAEINNLKLEVAKIYVVASDLRVLKESIEKDLSEKVEKLRLETVKISSIDTNIAVLKERIDNEIKMLDKLEEKLEDSAKEIKC